MTRTSIIAVATLISAAMPLARVRCQEREPGRVQEHVRVERIVISVRAIDRLGNPIPDLAAADFRLHVDGREAPIESVEWIPEGSRQEVQPVMNLGDPRRISASSASGSADLGAAEGPRLIVMLFQWEIAGQKDIGFVRMMRQATRFSESTRPNDLIAVFGFGSSLRLLQDFTTDRAAIGVAIQRIRLLTPRSAGFQSSGISLAASIEQCQRPDSIERSFICLGKALQQFPGPKTILFFGWTITSYRGSWHTLYPEVIESVEKAQAAVYVLNVSDGRHRLARGLKMIAYETGGLYQETHTFPDLARLRVQRSLEGRYEVVFRSPSPDRGWHQLNIELKGTAGTVLFQRWYQD